MRIVLCNFMIYVKSCSRHCNKIHNWPIITDTSMLLVYSHSSSPSHLHIRNFWQPLICFSIFIILSHSENFLVCNLLKLALLRYNALDICNIFACINTSVFLLMNSISWYECTALTIHPLKVMCCF